MITGWLKINYTLGRAIKLPKFAKVLTKIIEKYLPVNFVALILKSFIYVMLFYA